MYRLGRTRLCRSRGDGLCGRALAIVKKGPWLALFLLLLRLCSGLGHIGLGIKAGGNDGDADFITQGVIDDGTEDKVDVFVSALLHHGSRGINLVQAKVGAAGDGQQHAFGAFHRRFQ